MQKYKKNFLSDVIFEIKFPPILELIDGTSSPSSFQKTVIDEFPILQIRRGERVNIADLQNSQKTRREEFTSWVFFDRSPESNPTKIITLNYDNIILTYTNSIYADFSEFSKTIELILKALSDYPVKKANYIGLRYINQIYLQNGVNNDWEDLINKNLHVITSEFAENDVLRSMHSLEFREEDYYIQFNFGQFNSNYPSPISTKKEFVLDYTCRCKDYTDINAVQKISGEMNEIIVKWFEKSILNGLREKMGVVQ